MSARTKVFSVWITGVFLLTGLSLARQEVTMAAPTGITWSVTTSSDSILDGDLASFSGSLRFVLSHASQGDFVSFAEYDGDRIRVSSPLNVPDGVTVGHRRDEDCGSYMAPLAYLEAASYYVNPVVNLAAGSTLRNVNIGGGDVSVKINGSNVDLCGVGMGIQVSGEGSVASYPPLHTALIIDGDHAIVHRNYFNEAIVVTTHGSDTRIGDALTGDGESNSGGCGSQVGCPVSVFGDTNEAAQRVTIRDPFPRGLVGKQGSGISGGGDDPSYANNWAQTPTITSADTYDNFASVRVSGLANPNSLVDVIFNDGITVTRQHPVYASASGIFIFSGPLPVRPVTIVAVSTLNDPAYPNRQGSSSEYSNSMGVISRPGFIVKVWLPLNAK